MIKYSNPIFHIFPTKTPREYLSRGKGVYLYSRDGKKYLDFTSGSTQTCILGYGHPKVVDAIKTQSEKLCYIDYKEWGSENREKLASLLLSRAEHKLDKVFFTGQSGSESCEAAMKLSFQAHHDSGKTEKCWFISRRQSYHGTTLGSLAMGDRPNLDFFHKILPTKFAHISQHNPLHEKRSHESMDQYAKRSANELEDKINEIGPEKICAFIGETIMGGLVGDVPPAPSYWKYIREVCTKYDVHLIMDEVYCGTGTSGKIYCCDWDGVNPDFIMLGKTLGAGYCPLSAVITSSKIENAIINGQKRVGYSSTHQGHELSVAAALAAQQVIHSDELLEHVYIMGKHIRNIIREELRNHPFYINVRGRGLRSSFEYKCQDQNKLGMTIQNELKDKHNILVSGKWHRISFTPPIIITRELIDLVLERFIKTFKEVSKDFK